MMMLLWSLIKNNKRVSNKSWRECCFIYPVVLLNLSGMAAGTGRSDSGSCSTVFGCTVLMSLGACPIIPIVVS